MFARAEGVEPLSIDREPTTIGLANRAANRARGGVAVALLVAIFGSIVPPSATAAALKFAFTPVGSLVALQTSNPTHDSTAGSERLR